MLLYIVRHAWAEDRDERLWPDDGQRPLTADGRKRFAEVADALAERGVEPEIIASSPLVRCRETAQILASRLPGKPKVVLLDALKPNSDLNALIGWSATQKVNEVAWVGHSPDVEYLASALISDGSAQLSFKKGASAAIEFANNVVQTQGLLRWLVTAKILGV